MPPFEVILRGPATARVGDAIPVEVEVRNASSEAVWIAGVVGGSEEGSRYPHYLPRVHLGAALVAVPPAPEDTLVGPLRLSDFRSLAAGESFDPTRGTGGGAYLPLSTFANFRPERPGTYELTLVLSTESENPEQWLGRFGQEDRAAVTTRVRQVPRATVTSNTLAVAVR